MSAATDFKFNDDSVAVAYDNVLVPVLFEPWATRLVEAHGPWTGRRVLDLATGTGIVAQLLAREVGPDGRVIAVDPNAEMLAAARRRCAGAAPGVEFVESSAAPLNVPDSSVDVVVCQQGFQFFPDKPAAAAEIHRVLKPGGEVIVTTWLPVTECEYFGGVCDALTEIGETEISDLMRVPFDFMPGPELAGHLETAGFSDTVLTREERPMVMNAGLERSVDLAYATPVGPQLRLLPDEGRTRFEKELVRRLEILSPGGGSLGRMTTHVASARKPA